ncbi:MAG: GNAT family N-acetyltransferase [candidate division Zixibacteria bacterium]
MSDNMSNSQIDRINTVDEFDGLCQVWNELAESQKNYSIFQSFKWASIWWECFGDGHDLYILTVKRNDDIVGIAPLMKTDFNGPGRHKIISFLGGKENDYNGFIGTDINFIVDATLRYLMSHKNDWTHIDFSELPEYSHSYKCLRNILNNKYSNYRILESDVCLAYEYNGKSIERSEFSVRRNKTFRKKFNYFKKIGDVELEVIKNPDDVGRQMYWFFHNHINRWFEKGGISEFVNIRHQRFIRRLIEELCPGQQMFLLSLKCDDTRLAQMIVFHYRSSIHNYLLTHNMYYGRKSPGFIIYLQSLEKFIREGMDIVDFGRGRTQYKELLCNAERTNMRIKIYCGKFQYLNSVIYDSLKKLLLVRLFPGTGIIERLKSKFKFYKAFYGLKATFGKMLTSISRRIFEYRVFIIFNYNGIAENDLKPRMDGIHCRKLTPNWIERIVSFYGAGIGSDKDKTVRARFQNDCDCFAALYRNEIVAITWGIFTSDTEPESGFTLTPGENEVISSDTNTSPVFRGMRIGPYLLAYVFDNYKQKGLKVIGAVDKSNKAQMRSNLFLNPTPVRSKRIVRIFGRKIS